MAKIDVFDVAPRKGDTPFSPYLYIYLSEHFSDAEGHKLLSPKLMTDIEIDEAVDFLIMQLEKARKKAKSKLKKLKERPK